MLFLARAEVFFIAVESARRLLARRHLMESRNSAAGGSSGDAALICGACAGFTLIEALLALTVTAVVLTSIASLMATNIRGSGRIGQHLELIAALREIHAELPDRSRLANGVLAGEKAGHSWTIEISPFESRISNPRAAETWTPQMVVIKVRSMSGAVVDLETVRLRRRIDR
jgi:general secretion pathway protein I